MVEAEVVIPRKPRRGVIDKLIYFLVLAYRTGNCGGAYTFIGSNINSCMPTSAGSKFMSFRCGVLSAAQIEDTNSVEEVQFVEGF